MSLDPKFCACSATISNNYIVDPEGNLYKCRSEIGKKEKAIGDKFH